MSLNKAENTEQPYPPAIDLAFQLAVASQDAVIKRLDSVDGKLQTLLGFAAGLFAGIPAIGSAKGISFNSIWFYLAVIAMALAIVLSFIARLTGTVKMLNPSVLYQKWLNFSEREFKQKFIEYAGKAFETNNAVVYRKWRFTSVVSFILLLEAICLTMWVVSGRHS
jgi:hypothetical protein